MKQKQLWEKLINNPLIEYSNNQPDGYTFKKPDNSLYNISLTGVDSKLGINSKFTINGGHW